MEQGEQLRVQGAMHERPRDAAWDAQMDDFADIVDAQITDEGDRMELDKSAGRGGFVEDAVHFGLRHVDRFADPLREMVQGSYMTTGKILFDPERRGGIFLDALGNVVVLREQKFGADFGKAEYWKDRMLAPIEAEYEVLTGPDAGKTISTDERPLWRPTINGKTAIAEA